MYDYVLNTIVYKNDLLLLSNITKNTQMKKKNFENILMVSIIENYDSDSDKYQNGSALEFKAMSPLFSNRIRIWESVTPQKL